MDWKFGDLRQGVPEQEPAERVAKERDRPPFERQVPEPGDQSLADLLVRFGEGEIGEILRLMSRASERSPEAGETRGGTAETMHQEGTHGRKIQRRAAVYLVPGSSLQPLACMMPASASAARLKPAKVHP